MAQILDVTAGERRRQALVQKLMEQRRARERQQAPLSSGPLAGSARTALATPRSARPRFAGMSQVLKRLIPGLGPGGQGAGKGWETAPGLHRPLLNAPTPSPAGPSESPIPVPNYGDPEAVQQQAPAPTQWEPSGSTEGGMSTMGPGGATTIPTEDNPLAGPTDAAWADTFAQGGATPASQLVPLGNGQYFDPVTGQFFGAPSAATGSRGLFRS